jgi:sulfopyruvate decarboxylase subunit alpha
MGRFPWSCGVRLRRVNQASTTWAAGVCAGLYAAGSRHVVYVPDNPLAQVLKILADGFPDVTTTIATREEEAFGIAAGLYLGGARPTVMLQSSGLGNSLNALTSLLLPYQIPTLLLISMRGDPGEWNAAQVPMGRAVARICDAIGVATAIAETPETTAATVRLVGLTAFGTRLPGACLLPRRLTVPIAMSGTRS